MDSFAVRSLASPSGRRLIIMSSTQHASTCQSKVICSGVLQMGGGEALTDHARAHGGGAGADDEGDARRGRAQSGRLSCPCP